MKYNRAMNLNKLFYPKSLAVIGASNKEGKLGYNILHNLIDHGYTGRIYPVNPNDSYVQGIRAYSSVSDIEDDIDAAVTIVPAKITPAVVEECFKKGIKFVTVEAAGFGEIGEKGKKIERSLKKIIDEYGYHILGPNCTGVINVNIGLCESIGLVGPLKSGNLAIISQAGVYAAGILWGMRKIQDFSMIATIGNKIDLDETNLLEFMGKDETVDVVLMYLEDIRRGKEFLRVAREIVLEKPIVVLKGGRTKEGKKRAVTHTAAIGGSKQAYDTIFKEAGIIQADDNDHLFDLVRGFSKQPILTTNRIMVITYSGSQGITATDTLFEEGLALAHLSDDTRERLRELIPMVVAAINPADLTFDQYPEQVRRIIEITSKDPEVGGVIANLQPELLAEYTKEMRCLENRRKPILFSVTGREFVMDDVIEMEHLGFPVYSTPERAVQVMAAMHSFKMRRKWFNSVERFVVNIDKVDKILSKARKRGMNTIGGIEAIELLNSYGIPVSESRIARSSDEALRIGSDIEKPVAMKIESDKILHKSDIRGVELGIEEDHDLAFDRLIGRALESDPTICREDLEGVCIQPMVEVGMEVLMGCSFEKGIDCHVLKFGLGGKYTELFNDVATSIVPISRKRAEAMIGETKYIGSLLNGLRGESPYDNSIVIDVLLRLSQLVTDFPEIGEVEANPFIVWKKGGVVVDARLSLLQDR